MGGSKSKMVIMFVLLLIILEGGWSEGCLDHERFALLRLKHFFDDTGSYLPNWVDGEGATDCCQWERVECSNTTGRVIALDLFGTYRREYRWYLNASLFTPFQQLESLALRGNDITGFVENEGLERLSNLKRLDLSDNLFNNSILSSVAHLSSLTSLDLFKNRLEGSINVKEFDSLSNLEELHMSYNEIDNLEVPQGYKGLRKLNYLDLSNVGVRDGSKLLQSMGSFPSLNSLYLSSNNFTETVTITTQELHNFTNLEYLTLDYSSLHISLLQSIASIFPSLKNLSMSGCEVNGVLHGQGFPHFKSLEHLDMDFTRIALNTSFLQIISESMPSLKYLSLSDSNLSTNSSRILDQALETLSRLSNLTKLDLSYNLFNNSILSFVARLSSLTSLDLSYNGLEGSINVKEFDSLSNLEELDMSGNEIDNFEVPQGYRGLRKLKSLYLSRVGIRDGSKLLQSMRSFASLNTLYLMGNNFTDIATTTTQELHNFTNLEYLKLDDSSLHISLLQSIASIFPSLKKLSMSYCEVNGVVHGQELHNFTNLEYLALDSSSLHISLLQSIASLFPSLKNLTMYGCEVNGVVRGQGFPSFKSLERLDMSSTRIALNTSFLQIISESMPSLKYLSLSGSILGTNSSRILDQGLCSLVHLQELRMADNDLRGSLPWCLANMTSLRIVDVSSNQLTGSIFSSPLVHLTSIEELRLSNNHFQIPDQGLCSLVHLQELYIDNNDLRGSLPWCLANMTSLRIVDVSSNQLTGSISSSPLVHLTSIEVLMLSNNHFQIPISLEPFFNHSRLKSFDADNNEIKAEITESHSLTAPNFQLNRLLLSSGYGDGFIFPKFLYHQHDLETVDLSHIKMNGEFPNWLLENNTNLEYLFLVNDSLAGPFRLPIHSHKRLGMLDVSNNNFQGRIPVEIGDVLPSLNFFNISMNDLDGSIPSSFGNMKFLQSLDLSNNHLTGEIPEHLAVGCVNLQSLALSNNNLQGHLFSRNFNLANLMWLQLEGNHFVGEISQSLSKCSSLKGLFLNNNNLSGKIPRWLGNLTWLQYIIMPTNHLEGPIPVEFCQLDLLQILDISDNNISGSLPSCFHPLNIKQVHLSKNMLQGQLKRGTFFNCSSLVTLDLSYNLLNGSIPDWVDGLSRLSHLILGHNNLEGEVSVQLCELNQLQLLDLSNNNLHGSIPPCFDNTTLHESYNNSSSPDEQFEIFFSIKGPQGGVEKKIHEIFEFTTKNIAYIYQGKVLSLLSGLDLSCNKLIGDIPAQIGNLTRIQTLNLSHNNLTGLIPSTFSNLKHIESLDLSYNKLNGKIPHQLVELKTLAVFSVAYNNLSGEIPEWTAQFATFNESSYEGNTFLCGLPLPICRSPATMP